jgi:uncharacterized cupredoxin-like copper-binding protein
VRLSLRTAAATIAIALAGCGGDDGGNEEPSPAPARTAGETVNVTESDFKLDPANPTIDKPGNVTFRVTNEGAVEHSLEVEGPSGESELEKTLEPGDSGTLRVKLDKRGKYEWYCPIGNHRDLGMEGEVTVGRGGSAQREDRSQSDDSGGGTVTTPQQPTTPEDSGGGTGGEPATPQGGTEGPSTGGSGTGGSGQGTQPGGDTEPPNTGGSGGY